MKNNKGFIGLGLILAIVAVLAIGGGAYYLGTKKVSVPKDAEENNNSIDSILKSNIESFLVSGPYKAINKNDKVTCKITLYGYEDNYAYTSSYCSEFDSNLKLVTGSSFPARFKYDSSYKIISYNEAADGEGYRDSIKELFPAKFWDLIISPDISTKEESLTEIFNNQPGEIKSIIVGNDNQWTLMVDLLSRNPNFLPGAEGVAGDFFINQNTKIRNLTVTKNTKVYDCGANTKADVLQDTAIFISNTQQKNSYKIAYFDINGTNITAIYQQCLP